MSQSQPAPPPIITDAERHLRLIAETSDRPGAIEIIAGRTKLDAAGEPTDEIQLLCWTRQDISIPHTRKYFYIDPTQPDTIAAALTYARKMRDQWGNVYWSRCLYDASQDDGKYRRDERYAIPNRIVTVDDVPPEQAQDFAIYIQTSESSGHGHMLVDQPLNAVQYADIARRLAVHYGGDPSGVDYVQLIRSPNSINTKGYAGRQGYFVRLTRYKPVATPLEALRAALPCPTGHRGSTYPPKAPRAVQSNWRDLPDGAALVQSGRWQWMCRMRPQMRQLLLTHEPVVTYRSGGQVDVTPSAQRAALVSNLLQLHNPPPLAEIRAIALALQTYIGTDQTNAEYRDAIDREIATYLHIHYTAKSREYRPTPTTGARAQVPPAAPRPRGRSYAAEQTRAGQLARLRAILQTLPSNDYGAIVPDIAAIAAEMGKSPRMVRNYLHDLAAQEEIKFAASGRGRQLALILTNRFGKPNQPAAEKEIKSAPIAADVEPALLTVTPESPIVADTPLESTGVLGVYVLSQDSAQVSNSDAGDDLATMAQEYLATVQLGRKTISDETGEIKTRRSAKHFAELMQAEQPGRYSDAECQAAYDAEKMRLKALERAELQAYKARLRAMLPDDLVRHIRSGLRAEVAALARQGQIAYQVGHYRLRHKIAGEIAAKRGITISPTTKLTKPTRPAKLVQLTLTI